MTDIMVVGDIGGTNARFAMANASGTGYRDERIYACRSFDTPEAALRKYLEDIDTAPPQCICLAVAGPVVDGRAVLTNNPWSVDQRSLQAAFNCDAVALMNDFEAIAHSLPSLRPNDLLPIGALSAPDLSKPDYVVGVLGPGTGLGFGLLVSNAGRCTAIHTEGGHIGFAPESSAQMHVLSRLRSRFGRVSAERLISGIGIENVYWALSDCAVGEAPPTATEIFAQEDTDPVAQQAVALFFELIGQFAGDVALVTGAFDGIYIAGGIAQRYPARFQDGSFRAGFENKGRHAKLTHGIPTALVAHPQPGLLGAARYMHGQTEPGPAN